MSALSKALQKQYGITEMAMTLEKMQVARSEILDLAFVFPWADIINGSVDIVGMSHAYAFCSQRWDEHRVVTRDSECGYDAVPMPQLIPFPCLHPKQEHFNTCYARDIFDGITQVQKAMRRVLSWYARDAGNVTKYTTVASVSPTSWCYFKAKSEFLCPLEKHTSKEQRQLILPSLLVVHRNVSSEIEKMSYSSYDQLTHFQQLFGSTYIVGIQPSQKLQRQSTSEGPQSVGCLM
jgi:hypothetical protein